MKKCENWLEARLNKPEVTKDTIARQRLLDEIDKEEARILVLYGPMGYGKTSLLVSWCCLNRRQTAWCRAVEEDSNPEILARDLAASVRRVYPDFNFDVDQVLENTGGELGSGNLACKFGKAFYQLTEQSGGQFLDIILDDFHKISGDKAGQFLASLISETPEQVRLLIATRGVIPGFALRYLPNGICRLFCSQNLSLTVAEIEEEARKMHIQGQLENVARTVWKRTLGWPAGVTMIFFAMQNTAADGEKEIDRLCSSPVMKELVRSELVSCQPEEMREFMVAISPFDWLEEELCSQVLSESQAREKLYWLFQRGLIFQEKATSGKYSWNPLLRDYLSGLLPEKEKKKILERASCWLLRKGRIKEAAIFAMQAGNGTILEEILQDNGIAMLEGGELEELEQWSNFLVGRGGGKKAFTLFLDGLIQRKRKREHSELKSFEMALEKSKEERNQDIYIKTLFGIARCLAERGEGAQAEACMRAGVEKELEPYSRPWYDGMAGWIRIRLIADQEKGALELLEQILRPQNVQYLESPSGWQMVLKTEAANLVGILTACNSLQRSAILARLDQEDSPNRFAESFCAAKLILSGNVNVQEIHGLLKRLDSETQTACHARARVEGGYLLFMLGFWKEAACQICTGIEALSRMRLFISQDEGEKIHKIYQIYAISRGNMQAARQGNHLIASCFGRFRISVLETGQEIKWRTRKARECMAFLLHQEGKGVTRDELIDALWDEGNRPKNEIVALHNILSSIRKSFTDFEEEIIVFRDKKYYVKQDLIYTDIGLAKEIVTAVRSQEFEKLLSWENLIEFFAEGAYLDNVEGQWVVQNRYFYERYFYEGLVGLGTCHMDRGEFYRAEHCMQRALLLEPYGLSAITGLMDCYGRTGDELGLSHFYKELLKNTEPGLCRELKDELKDPYEKNRLLCRRYHGEKS